MQPFIAWKVSKYGVISGPDIPVFWPEITPYLDTFHAVIKLLLCQNLQYFSYYFRRQPSTNKASFEALVMSGKSNRRIYFPQVCCFLLSCNCCSILACIWLFKSSNGNTRISALNRFQALFWCFYCCLWENKCRQ